ncbi:MAG TPA: hypothetical protein VEW68_06755 [Patescibacteria group bacterium]|nr:hypothetical protein [Patescibacteria group bacterium]
MTPTQAAAGIARDRGLDRLRTLTIATAVGATGLAAVLSMVAAWSIPGAASTGASNQVAGQDPSQTQSLGEDGQGFTQNPFAGFVGGGGGTPVAVSGGSHH